MLKISDLKIIGGPGCGGGTCPTLYRSEDGRLFIQGYKLKDSHIDKKDIPENEDIVEISEYLVRQIQNDNK